MDEWGVVGVLAALVGLAATLVTPMIRLNTTMTHAKLAGRIGSVRGDVNAHETRITVLEKGGK